MTASGPKREQNWLGPASRDYSSIRVSTMCGRFALSTPNEVIQAHFCLPVLPTLFPRSNIAPSQAIPVVRLSDDTSRELVLLKWGLVPFWAKEKKIGNKLINARAETLLEKPSFRDSFRKKRCLIVATSFYEWQTLGKKKVPIRFALKDGAPLAFAGLHASWCQESERIDSCTIITTSANALLEPIHDRMPVILEREHYEPWLAKDTKIEELQSYLRAFPEQAMSAEVCASGLEESREGGQVAQQYLF